MTTRDYYGHVTRFSDSTIYDEVCTLCGATDAAGDGRLGQRCPVPNRESVTPVPAKDSGPETDSHIADPGKRWEFDEGVTRNFQPMLRQSIPGLEDMRAFTTVLASSVIGAHAGDHPPRVIDLGASRGDAVAPLMQRFPHARFTLCEVSPDMMRVLEECHGTNERVELVSADLSEHVDWIVRARPHLVLSVLTLMFVPMENRQALVQAVFDGLRPGGAFIVVEKTLGNSSASQRVLVDTYHAFKRANGYTDDAVERKRMSLKGALVPAKATWTAEMLRDAGFVDLQEYWRALQFVGMIAFKPK